MLDVEAIKNGRAARGLTQTEAASLAGWRGPQTWSLIESGATTNINLITLERIAKVLRVSPCSLLTCRDKS